MSNISRRNMIKGVFKSGIGLMLPISFSLETSEGLVDRYGKSLPTRLLGETGEYITILGLGGNHLAALNEIEAQKVIETAIHGGIRFFETAVSYGDGRSEERYGKYLTPKYRDKIFLASKTHAKNAKTAQEHLELTLRRLNTDYIDLWQVHGVSQPVDVMQRYIGDVHQVMQKAKESGKVRHIGFTGHKSYLAHKTVLLKNVGFETCQMPINVADPSYKSYIHNIMPTLIKKKYGILAMKTLACGGFFGGRAYGQIPYGTNPSIIPDLISVEEALHFVWSLPVTSIVIGYDNARMVEENIKFARNYITMSPETQHALIHKVSDIAKTGTMEWYKR